MKQLDIYNEQVPPRAPKAGRALSAKPEVGPTGFVSSIWEFPRAEPADDQVDPLYRWYGTLPPALVLRLIEMYTRKGDLVLDLFSGIGTTLVQAARTGRRSLGLDSNPLACLLSQFQLDPPRESMEKVRSQAGLLRIPVQGEEQFAREALSDASFAYSKKWFHPRVLEDLLRAAYRVGSVGNPKLRLACLVALANVAKSASYIDSRCTHHLVTKRRPALNVFPLLPEAVERVVNLGQKLGVPGNHESRVIQADATELTAGVPRNADLVIAHPPYLGVITYNLIHRPATDLLAAYARQFHEPTGLDFRFERIKDTDLSTDDDARYLRKMDVLSERIVEDVGREGRCVFIIGDSRYKGFLRHPSTYVISSLEEKGLKLQEDFIWLLNNNSGLHIKRRGHYIDHNFILVFARGS